MSKRRHKEFEKTVIHLAVESFLQKNYNAQVFRGISIPLKGYPRPVTRVQMDVLGLTPNFSILVECKLNTTPYSFGVGLGELLFYWTLLRSKIGKSQVEEKIGATIPEPILPYLSVCDLGPPLRNRDHFQWTVWGTQYKKLFKDLRRRFKAFKPGLLLVTRRRHARNIYAQDLEAKDIRVLKPIFKAHRYR